VYFGFIIGCLFWITILLAIVGLASRKAIKNAEAPYTHTYFFALVGAICGVLATIAVYLGTPRLLGFEKAEGGAALAWVGMFVFLFPLGAYLGAKLALWGLRRSK